MRYLTPRNNHAFFDGFRLVIMLRALSHLPGSPSKIIETSTISNSILVFNVHNIWSTLFGKTTSRPIG